MELYHFKHIETEKQQLESLIHILIAKLAQLNITKQNTLDI